MGDSLKDIQSDFFKTIRAVVSKNMLARENILLYSI